MKAQKKEVNNGTNSVSRSLRETPDGRRSPYIEGLGLKVCWEDQHPNFRGLLSERRARKFAILKFKYDEPAKTEGMLRYTGIHHFGLEVEDMAEARARIEKAGAVHRPYPGTEEMAKRGNVEVKFTVPDGVTIDPRARLGRASGCSTTGS
jgi:hypothetical protein